MKKQHSIADEKPISQVQSDGQADSRKGWQAPRLTKKRSVARVTLFTGGGVSAGGVTSGG